MLPNSEQDQPPGHVLHSAVQLMQTAYADRLLFLLLKFRQFLAHGSTSDSLLLFQRPEMVNTHLLKVLAAGFRRLFP